MARRKTVPVEAQKPPWTMTEEEQAQAAAQAQAEADAKPIPKEQGERPPSNYAFGRLWEVDCPFYPGLSVMFHVGAKYGILAGNVKDDDGKGSLRRYRMIAPFYKGWPPDLTNPLTEEVIKCPVPDDLDSYGAAMDSMGGDFIDWLLKAGWDQAIEEASGTDAKNS